MCWIGIPVTGYYNIYVDTILWYFVIFEYTTVVNISENKTAFKIAALGLQGLCDNGSIYNNSQWDPVRVCARKIKCSWMHSEINYGGAFLQLGA